MSLTINACKKGQCKINTKNCQCESPDPEQCFSIGISILEVPMTNPVARWFGNRSKRIYARFNLTRHLSRKERAEYMKWLDHSISHINDTTHDCVQVVYKCETCHEEFPYIYEYGSGGKTKKPGSYSKVIQVKRTSINRRSMIFINEQFEKMYGDGNEYNLITRNCKYWARSFFMWVVYLDPSVISIQDFLDEKVHRLKKIFNQKSDVIALTYFFHWFCLDIQYYISDMPLEWQGVLDLFFSIDDSSFTESLFQEFSELFGNIVANFNDFIAVLKVKNKLEKIRGSDRSKWSLTNSEISENFDYIWSVSYASEIIKELRNPDTLEAKLNGKLIETKNLVDDFICNLPDQQPE